MYLLKQLTLGLAAFTALLIPAEAFVQPKTLDDYPLKWFLTHAIVPTALLKDRCLLYSSGLSKTARKLAKIPQFVTIWQLWPEHEFTDDPDNEDNDMRELIDFIVTRETDRYDENPDVPARRKILVKTGTPNSQLYFARMSTAMAMLCSGEIRSVHKNIKAIPLEGIFRQTELRTVQDKMAFAARRPDIALNQVSAIFAANLGVCIVQLNSQGTWPSGLEIDDLPTGAPFTPLPPPGSPVRRNVAGRVFVKREDNPESHPLAMEIYDASEDYGTAPSHEQIWGELTMEQAMEAMQGR